MSYARLFYMDPSKIENDNPHHETLSCYQILFFFQVAIEAHKELLGGAEMKARQSPADSIIPIVNMVTTMALFAKSLYDNTVYESKQGRIAKAI